MPPKVQNSPSKKRSYRTGQITFEQAKEKFNNYYNLKNKTIQGIQRGKKFDKMYQKKPKYQIKCNTTKEYDAENDLEAGKCEKGSVKYLLKHGPKTFDISGLDSFKEDELITNDDGSITKSRGSTFKKKNDTNNQDIYGPRTNEGELYSSYFKKEYDQDVNKKVARNNKSNLDSNLVNHYWNEYDKDPNKYNRKQIDDITKKNEKKLIEKNEYKFIYRYPEEVENYLFRIKYNEDLIVNIYDNEDLLDINDDKNYEIIEYLLSLGIIYRDDNKKLKFNKDIDKKKIFEVHGHKYQGKDMTYLLDVETSNLFILNDSYQFIDTMDFWQARDGLSWIIDSEFDTDDMDDTVTNITFQETELKTDPTNPKKLIIDTIPIIGGNPIQKKNKSNKKNLEDSSLDLSSIESELGFQFNSDYVISDSIMDKFLKF